MAKQKRGRLLVLLILLGLLSLSGCGQQGQGNSEPNEFMAWSFARGLVRVRLDQPNKAIFPQYSRQFVERPEDDLFIVRAHVSAPDENGVIVSYNFTVTARYLGNQVFQETAVELQRAP